MDETEFLFGPHYNIAPTQTVPVVISKGGRRLIGCRWGLVPFWAKDLSIGNRMINAKSETLAEKPAFKYALERRRCLIPADGFYEWQKKAKGPSKPFYIRRRDAGLFAFAGLWENWISPEGEKLRSCTIITVDPNDLVSQVHDRMPAILARQDEAAWLEMPMENALVVLALLRSYPDAELEMYAVSRAVSSPTPDDPSLIEPQPS